MNIDNLEIRVRKIEDRLGIAPLPKLEPLTLTKISGNRLELYLTENGDGVVICTGSGLFVLKEATGACLVGDWMHRAAKFIQQQGR